MQYLFLFVHDNLPRGVTSLAKLGSNINLETKCDIIREKNGSGEKRLKLASFNLNDRLSGLSPISYIVFVRDMM